MNSIKCSTAAKAAAFILAVFAGTAAVFAGGFAVFYKEGIEMLFGPMFWSLNECHIICAVCSFIFIVLTVFLVSAAGHHDGSGEAGPGWTTAIPPEIVAGACGLASIGAAALWASIIDDSYYYSIEICWYISIFAGAAVFSCGLAFLMDFALKIKLGKWWERTLCWKLGILAVKLLKWGWVNIVCAAFGFTYKVLRKLKNAVGSFISGMPLVRKGMLAILGICGAELIMLLICWHEHDMFAMFWFLEKLVLVPALVYSLINMKKLQIGAETLAGGDLSYRVDTDKLFWDFKKHGENLNSMALGNHAAVEKQMKSERMKTELITNVSHDIKTPLTSIINYTDLISKEKSENEKINEYTEVLQRQSVRLKKLLEDLLEASKANTGNLEVNLEPCDAGTLLSQAEGEYSEKIEKAGLSLVLTAPEEKVFIMADGRRIWRVFDNLMNNICKYSQEGTRVYIGLTRQGKDAVITFRNTSRDPLNISPDELMERFVRGDSSRNTEGSGLGLSIARSFTELQKGAMDIDIDGDLFKVILRFPAI